MTPDPRLQVEQESEGDEVTTPGGGVTRVDAGERSRRIRALLSEGDQAQEPERKLALYAQAHRLDLNDPLAMSAHGMALATVRGAYQQGIVFCEEAVRRIGANPDLLVNLARAYTAASSKREAVRCLRRALARSGGTHSAALAELFKLGLRKKPVIPFLPRSFFLNKYLGKLRHRLFHAKQQADDGRLPVPAELGRLSGDVEQARLALDGADERTAERLGDAR